MKGFFKKYKLYIFIIIIMFPICCLLFIDIWNANIKEINDISIYMNNSYVNYNGGAEARQFFDDYVNIENYENISFYYRNAGKIIGTRDYKTVFALDVQYKKDDFFEIAREKVVNTDKPALIELGEVGFIEYVVTEDNPLYYNNHGVFYIDIDKYTIRYCFVYDLPRSTSEYVDVRHTLFHSTNLVW